MGASKRRRIEPTHEWELLLPLFEWLKALRLEDYAPRRSGRPEMLQQVLFAYTDAL